MVNSNGQQNAGSSTRLKFACYLGLFFLIFNLSSCHRWPIASTGGYAAHYPMKLKYSKINPRDPLQQSLRTYYQLTRQLLILKNSQVQRCYPARMFEMALLSQQIAQEIAASLTLSAIGDITLLEKNIAAVWGYRYVKGCPKLRDNPNWQRLQSRIQ
jgi:hypothetical protein